MPDSSPDYAARETLAAHHERLKAVEANVKAVYKNLDRIEDKVDSLVKAMWGLTLSVLAGVIVYVVTSQLG